NLPPFPGPGWTPDTPVASAITNRATYWNPQLWNFGSKVIVKPYVQEQFGGRWLTFVAAWHPGDKGPQTFMATECWRLASSLPVADPASVTPQNAPVPVATAQMGPVTFQPNASLPAALPVPAQVEPYPGPGAWQSNSVYIQRYQTALTWLAWKLATPELDPGGIDGVCGANTKAAVVAFQGVAGVTQDGECGAGTASALDAKVTALTTGAAGSGAVSGARAWLGPADWYVKTYKKAAPAAWPPPLKRAYLAYTNAARAKLRTAPSAALSPTPFPGSVPVYDAPPTGDGDAVLADEDSGVSGRGRGQRHPPRRKARARPHAHAHKGKGGGGQGRMPAPGASPQQGAPPPQQGATPGMQQSPFPQGGGGGG